MHSCPDCGQACTCGGDIDDMEWGDDPSCTHCPIYDVDWEDDEDWSVDDTFIEPTPTGGKDDE